MFRRGGGLGLTAYLIVQHLRLDGPKTINELATALNIKPATVRRKLTRMTALAMARHDDDGYWRILPFNPDTVATAVGTAGKAAAQRSRHDQESHNRAHAVQQWAQRAQNPKHRASRISNNNPTNGPDR
jgi:hypothetical protein